MSLIIMGLIVSLCACSKPNEAVNTEIPTSVPTEAPTPEPTEVPTSIPTDSNVIENTESNNTNDNTENSTTDKTEEVPSISDIPVAPDNSETEENETVDKNDAEKFPGEDEEPTKVPTQAPTEAPVEPTPGTTEDTEEPTVIPTPTEKPEEPTVTPTPTEKPEEPTVTPTPTEKPVEPTVTPTPTTKPEEPTVTPSPTPTEKPDSSIKVIWQSKDYPENEAGYGDGKDITLDTIGIKVPTLKDFNQHGVDTGNKGWIGKTADEEGILHDVLGDVAWALIDKEVIGTTNQAFLYGNYSIGWSWSTGSSDIYLDRDPATDTYTLTINRSLKYDYSSGMQIDRAPYNRDIVKVFCSIVSSQPELLFSTLLEDLTGDVCISDTSYTPVGDCKVKFEIDDSTNGHYVYTIKANK